MSTSQLRCGDAPDVCGKGREGDTRNTCFIIDGKFGMGDNNRGDRNKGGEGKGDAKAAGSGCRNPIPAAQRDRAARISGNTFDGSHHPRHKVIKVVPPCCVIHLFSTNVMAEAQRWWWGLRWRFSSTTTVLHVRRTTFSSMTLLVKLCC